MITSTFENVSDIGTCLGLSLGLRLKPVSGRNGVQFSLTDLWRELHGRRLRTESSHLDRESDRGGRSFAPTGLEISDQPKWSSNLMIKGTSAAVAIPFSAIARPAKVPAISFS